MRAWVRRGPADPVPANAPGCRHPAAGGGGCDLPGRAPKKPLTPGVACWIISTA